ncbi:MAG: nitrogen regulation protein NR(II) [Planctomycetota bacterium]
MPPRAIAAAALIIVSVFALDLIAVRGVVVAHLYCAAMIPCLITRHRPESRAPAIIALLAAGVLLLGWLLGSAHTGSAGNSAVAGINRGLAIAMLWLLADVCQRRQRDARAVGMTRAALAQSQQQLGASLQELQDYKAALDQSAIVAITDRKGVISFANATFCQISGYALDELLGNTHRIINSGHHPPEFFLTMWRTISSGKVWRGEICNRAKQGHLYWVDTTIVPFLDASGRPHQYVAIRFDITARVAAEAAARRKEWLARIGELASIIAHEVRNPLAAIRGALQIIERRLPDGSDEREVAGEVIERVDALNSMVTDLLAYARPKPPAPTEVPLHDLLDDTIRHVRRDPDAAGITIDLACDPMTVRADSPQLVRLFSNLLHNAVQALQGREGDRRVAVSVVPSSDSSDSVDVCVADNGPGVPAAMRSTIFEPFFSTRHRGTGLGLAIASRVIDAHGGSLTLEDTPGGGATFRVRLPLAGPPAPAD